MIEKFVSLLTLIDEGDGTTGTLVGVTQPKGEIGMAEGVTVQGMLTTDEEESLYGWILPLPDVADILVEDAPEILKLALLRVMKEGFEEKLAKAVFQNLLESPTGWKITKRRKGARITYCFVVRLAAEFLGMIPASVASRFVCVPNKHYTMAASAAADYA